MLKEAKIGGRKAGLDVVGPSTRSRAEVWTSFELGRAANESERVLRFDGLRDGSQPDDQKNLGRLSTGIISISEEVNTAFRTGPQRQMFVHPVDSIQTDNSPKLALNMIHESSSQNKKCTFLFENL